MKKHRIIWSYYHEWYKQISSAIPPFIVQTNLACLHANSHINTHVLITWVPIRICNAVTVKHANLNAIYHKIILTRRFLPGYSNSEIMQTPLLFPIWNGRTLQWRVSSWLETQWEKVKHPNRPSHVKMKAAKKSTPPPKNVMVDLVSSSTFRTKMSISKECNGKSC